MKRTLAPLGLILWEGDSPLDYSQRVVVIATLHSSNRKTGNMVQVWILPASIHPETALIAGRNRGSCGDCPLQGKAVRLPNGRMKLRGRACYVNRGQGSASVYNAYRRGRYAHYVPELHADFIRGRVVRFGADGDPAAIPLHIVQHLTSLASGWTGYTHHWPRMSAETAAAWQPYLMASTHNKAGLAEALRRGWRVFHAVPEGEPMPPQLLPCPAVTHGITCEQCKLCCGTTRGARSIVIEAHALAGRNLAQHSEAL